jgi:hypothetical protein
MVELQRHCPGAKSTMLQQSQTKENKINSKQKLNNNNNNNNSNN